VLSVVLWWLVLGRGAGEGGSPGLAHSGLSGLKGIELVHDHPSTVVY